MNQMRAAGARGCFVLLTIPPVPEKPDQPDPKKNRPAPRAGKSAARPSGQQPAKPVARPAAAGAKPALAKPAQAKPAGAAQPNAAKAPFAPAPGKKPPRRSSNTMLIGLAAGGVLMAAVAVIGLVVSREDAVSTPSATVDAKLSSPPTPAATVVPANADSPATAAEVAHNGIIEVADDGRTLWASPTSGKPLTFDYLPSGTQAFIVLRRSTSWRPAKARSCSTRWDQAGLGPATGSPRRWASSWPTSSNCRWPCCPTTPTRCRRRWSPASPGPSTRRRCSRPGKTRLRPSMSARSISRVRAWPITFRPPAMAAWR